MRPTRRPWRERPRWLHRIIAAVGGYFWLPCPSCGQMFGGHEWRPNSWIFVVDPDHPDGYTNMGICPVCTRAGVDALNAWPPREIGGAIR